MSEKNIVFKVEVIDTRTNTIQDRFKTKEPISVVEALIKYGNTFMSLEIEEAIRLWDKDIGEVENDRKKPKK